MDNKNLIVNHINPISKFLIWCSGARVSILEERDECAVEINRYASIGATICLTALFACIAATYALYKIFIVDDLSLPSIGPGTAFAAGGTSLEANETGSGGWTHLIPFILGLLWGITIFNLDRIIVSSMRKKGEWWEQLLVAIPRILVAIIISITIAKPLEVRLFEDRIYLALAEKRDSKFDESTGGYDAQINSNFQFAASTKTRLDSLERASFRSDPTYIAAARAYQECEQDRISFWQSRNGASLRNTRNDLNERRQALNRRLAQNDLSPEERVRLTNEKRQVDGDFTRAENAYAPVREGWNQRNERCKVLAGERDTIRRDVSEDIESSLEIESELYRETQENLSNTRAERDSVAQVMNVALNRGLNDNFIAQIEALGDLTEEDDSLKYASWMIMLLFILIETAPVFVKLITPRGPYDEAIDLMQSIASTRKDSDVQSSQKIADYRNNIREKCEVEIINNYMKRYAAAQIRVNKRRFDRWEQVQINKVNSANPDELI